MNVNTGEIREWDSLSPEQRASGEWVKLPPHDADGHCFATNDRFAREMTPEQMKRMAADHARFKESLADIPRKEYSPRKEYR